MASIGFPRDQVGRIAADPPHGADPFQAEVVWPVDHQIDLGRPDVIEAESVVEQAHERPDGAGGVVVLGLGQRRGAAVLEIAQVDVVAEANRNQSAPLIKPRACSHAPKSSIQ
jgi:hypothetical protein